jgi:hypothetical protein
MTRRNITVTGLDRWITGLDRMDKPTAVAREEWLVATEVFFDRTQAAVHVLSGDLKSSGTYGAQRRGQTIDGWVKYGGTADCDYAVYEFARGGSHDALTIGFVAAEREFTAALTRILDREVASWR